LRLSTLFPYLISWLGLQKMAIVFVKSNCYNTGMTRLYGRGPSNERVVDYIFIATGYTAKLARLQLAHPKQAFPAI